MAVGAVLEEIEPLITGLSNGLATIVCYNSPNSLTIAGDDAAIDELGMVTRDLGILSRKLYVDQVYHSDHMLPLTRIYYELVHAAFQWYSDRGAANDSQSEVTFYSTVTGGVIAPERLKSAWYWQRIWLLPSCLQLYLGLCSRTWQKRLPHHATCSKWDLTRHWRDLSKNCVQRTRVSKQHTAQHLFAIFMTTGAFSTL